MQSKQTKYVVVTGGVVSGLGKGTATAAIARLLKDNKNIVTVKCDGYLNVDPGTMNPIEHGEVYVLDDGGEVDMDFGHYERFVGNQCKSDWNLTSGKVFNRIILKERRGDFLGKTIQIYPHLPREIRQWWAELARRERADVMMIEIGGTVGDIENSWFIEAARQLRKEVGHENVAYVHLTYVPFLECVGEQKTKPAQRDCALLRELGIYPDIILARSTTRISMKIKEKLAVFCDVEPLQILSCPDVHSVYELPLLFSREGLYDLLQKRLGLEQKAASLGEWEQLVEKIQKPKDSITIGICGKYIELRDSYASVVEALIHAGAHENTRVNIDWIDTTEIEQGKDVRKALEHVDGIIVPGGFGSRGVEGKISTIGYARLNALPFFGLCYGLQLAVVEFARNVCQLSDANTTEINPDTKSPVIDILPEQQSIDKKGGTMRLGGVVSDLLQGSIVQTLYGASTARERHRHRYEVNPLFHDVLQKNGMILSGTSMGGKLVEFIELKDHPFFVATQAHNELTSRLEHPNPLFSGLVRAALARKANKKNA